MRKWLMGLLVVVIFWALLRMSGKREAAPFRMLGGRIRKTLSMLAWILLSAYIGSFIYWLITAVFGK